MGKTFVHLDSFDRLNPNDPTSSCSVIWPDIIETYTDKNVSIESAIIPYSFYAINQYNKTITTSAGNIVLVPGNYTITQFRTMFDAAVVTASLGFTTTSTYSDITGKLTVTANTGNFTITSNNDNYNILGMKPRTTVSSVSSVWVSPGVIDIAGSRYIDVLLSDQLMSSVNSSNTNRNILGRIYITCGAFETIFLTSESFNEISLGSAKFSQCMISLVDEHQNLIDLNGRNWSISISVATAN